jgi:penicillin-binding protein 1A
MEECGSSTRPADSPEHEPVAASCSTRTKRPTSWRWSAVLEKEGERVIYEGGLTVYTTLDLDWQSRAETFLEDEMARLEKDTRTKQSRAAYLEARDKGKNPELDYLQGAALVFDAETGSIRVLIGGRSYDESNFNRATSALRQPGSAFKPFIYLTAIQKGYYPSYVVVDAPVVFYVAGRALATSQLRS